VNVAHAFDVKVRPSPSLRGRLARCERRGRVIAAGARALVRVPAAAVGPDEVVTGDAVPSPDDSQSPSSLASEMAASSSSILEKRVSRHCTCSEADIFLAEDGGAAAGGKGTWISGGAAAGTAREAAGAVGTGDRAGGGAGDAAGSDEGWW